MAIAQAWQRSITGEAAYGGPLKQGTGWNPIHAIRDGDGRNIAPDGTTNLVSEDLTSDPGDEYGYTDEDMFMFGDPPGYGAENPRELGITDRPVWGEDEGTRTDMPTDYPSWGAVNDLNGSNGQLPVGIPGGTVIRAQEKGAVASNTANVLPDETVTQGWRNKASRPDEYEAEIADPISMIMQTSAIQRNKVREGSQISGTASEYSAPVKSRTMGPKLKFWSGEQRHYDMAPKAQEQMVRPFWLRTGGTGDPTAMAPNEMYLSEPYQRTPPSDPYLGEVLPLTEVPDDSTSYGFTPEDQVW